MPPLRQEVDRTWLITFGKLVGDIARATLCRVESACSAHVTIKTFPSPSANPTLFAANEAVLAQLNCRRSVSCMHLQALMNKIDGILSIDI